MLTANQKLDMEMAAISVAKSSELVSIASDSSALNKYQNVLSESSDRLGTIKELLTGTTPAQVSTLLAKSIDSELSRLNVVTVDADGVAGNEALGFTLMPKDYLNLRVTGCEGMLKEIVARSGWVLHEIGIGFKDAYTLLRETNDSLDDRLNGLTQDLEGTGKFNKGTSTLKLGFRLFNIFQVNRAIKEDWVGQLTKVGKTINGLSNNYYVISKNNLNTIYSYFGGFEGLSAEQAKERLLMLPKSIPSVRFKECTNPDKENSTPNVVAMRSVELMGGRYFIDTRAKDPNLSPKTIDEVEEYLTRYFECDKTVFNNKPTREYDDAEADVASLGSNDIKDVIKQLRTILKEWEKVYDEGDKYRVAERDYQSIDKALAESSSEWDKEDAKVIRNAFSYLVRNNQQELMNIRSKVNSYLVFLFNGIVELCYDSIRVNQVADEE